jgi:hypothetical protein
VISRFSLPTAMGCERAFARRRTVAGISVSAVVVTFVSRPWTKAGRANPTASAHSNDA